MVNVTIENAPNYFLVVLALALVGWIGIKAWRTHVELRGLLQDFKEQKSNAIADAWLKIRELRKEGLTGSEFEAAKKAILDPLIKPREGEDKIAKSDKHPVVSRAESNRFSLFIQGIVHFGFFTVWSAGWGYGWGVFVVPLSEMAWSWGFGSENGALSMVWKSVVLILCVFVAMGFWIVPVCIAFLEAIGGFLDMAIAIFSNYYIIILREKIKLKSSTING